LIIRIRWKSGVEIKMVKDQVFITGYASKGKIIEG
jgi:hypothetical protein